MYLIFKKIFLIFFIFCINELCFGEEKNLFGDNISKHNMFILFYFIQSITCVYFYYYLIE
jgi:hypothetical protein